jgi:DNA polymerase III subunit delta'
MSFTAFPEQTPVVTLLQRSLGCGRLAHAYLFSGNDLAEMQDLARTLAKTLNCQNPPKRGANGLNLDCCDHCLSCRRIDSANHPDVQWLRPESKMRNITIDQTRDLIQTINLKPTEADYKVAIIVAADRMNNQAANAFLKTLEEPPPRSILILLTCALDQILETILSRCLRLHFAGDAGVRLDASGRTWFENVATLAQQPQKSLLGRYRILGLITARLAQLKEGIQQQLEAASPLNRYPDAEKDTREKWEAELNAAIEAEYRRKRSELLLLLEWWMRDIWLAAGRMSETLRVFPELSRATEGIAQRITAEQATENVRVFERLHRQLTTNVQEALALEVGLLKLRL